MTTCYFLTETVEITHAWEKSKDTKQQENQPQRENVQVNVEIVAHQVMENHQQLMYGQLNNTEIIITNKFSRF